MSAKWRTKIVILTSLAVLSILTLTACGKKQETIPEESALASEEPVEQVENEAQTSVNDAGNAAVLQEFTGEMDLTGSWDDEVSQRASMEVARNDDGSYEIRVHWGSSARETAVWEIHGTYDEAAGMLSYEDGEFTIHTWEDQNKETISGKEITKGAFMKEGSKLRWSDSQNSEDCVFVKAE